VADARIAVQLTAVDRFAGVGAPQQAVKAKETGYWKDDDEDENEAVIEEGHVFLN